MRRPHPLTVAGMLVWGVAAWLWWTRPPVHAGWPCTGTLDARPWLEQRAYWEAVTYHRQLIAKRFRGSPAQLAAYQARTDSAYDPWYLLLRADTTP